MCLKPERKIKFEKSVVVDSTLFFFGKKYLSDIIILIGILGIFFENVLVLKIAQIRVVSMNPYFLSLSISVGSKKLFSYAAQSYNVFF